MTNRMPKKGRIVLTPMLNEFGRLIGDFTIAKTGDEKFMIWGSSAAQKYHMRWFEKHQPKDGSVRIHRFDQTLVGLSIAGPKSQALLQKLVDEDVSSRAFRFMDFREMAVGGAPCLVNRITYTGDLGYEIWMPWEEAPRVWDALMAVGGSFDLRPAGMIALDIARIEAGLLLIDVDYFGSHKALIPGQKYSPFELGLGRLVKLDKGPFVGRAALLREHSKGAPRQIVGLEIDWLELEALFEKVGLPPQVPATASRIAVPIYRHETQVGKATSTTWSPVLKKLIALATVDSNLAEIGEKLKIEMTVEAVRHQVTATVVKTPFYNPPRKTALLGKTEN
jgi:glycine cleavage system aminomethyltransferase T